jgi:hypothetical protein
VAGVKRGTGENISAWSVDGSHGPGDLGDGLDRDGRRSTDAGKRCQVDVPALFEFLGDPVAMQHTHTDACLRECRRRVAVHEWRHRHDGYAPWTAIAKSNGRTIALGGLYDDHFDPGWGVEVTYFFHPSTWDRAMPQR